MTEIELYLADLASRLRVSGRDRARILGEVRDHLDDATSRRERSGETHQYAVRQALDTFGSPSLLATQFNAATGTRAMRRAPVIAFAAGVAVFAGFMLAGTTQPRTPAPTNADLATQMSFFVGVLALEVAVVAGICAASRALALWRTSAARGNDRQFVRRCATISTAAAGVTAAAWATTTGLAFNRLAHPNTPTLVLGAAIMVGAATIAILTVYRLRVNPSDEAGNADLDASGLFGLGERTVGLVRRHPVASCITVAALSAIPAMSHAETTFSGALPWGMLQAATVVLGFVTLGPSLGLRPPRPA